MNNYSVAQVEAITGIKAHTLRIWERRYQFLNPSRTDTNIRFYSDDELKKLLNISILIRNGYRPSKLNELSEEEIFSLVSDLLSNENHETKDLVDALIMSTIEMNEQKFNQIYQLYAMRNGLLMTFTELIYPYLSQIGLLWITNKVIPAQEHFVSNLIRQKIIFSIESLPNPSKDSPSILLFLTEGEFHEIGLLLSAFIAKEMGCRIFYLGQNVPSENIKNVISTVHPTWMMTLLTIPPPDIQNILETIISNSSEVPLLIAGNHHHIPNILSKKGVVAIQHPKDFISFLSKSL